MQEKYLNTNLGCSYSNPLQRKYIGGKSEFHLTSPDRILVDPTQDWLTLVISTLALGRLYVSPASAIPAIPAVLAFA